MEELLDNRKDLMERLRKLEATKAKGLRSQAAEGEDIDASIAKVNGDIELTNCQVWSGSADCSLLCPPFLFSFFSSNLFLPPLLSLASSSLPFLLSSPSLTSLLS